MRGKGVVVRMGLGSRNGLRIGSLAELVVAQRQSGS